VQSPSGDCHPGASTIPLISKNFYLHRLQFIESLCHTASR
jgi:hypothetical protein